MKAKLLLVSFLVFLMLSGCTCVVVQDVIIEVNDNEF